MELKALWRGLASIFERLVSYLSLMDIRSELPLDVVIPAAPKDADVLPYSIDGVRRNVRHPIGRIFVVAPHSERMQQLCQRKGCEYVDERRLADIDPESISIQVNGIDRSKWIYQQFLKWSGDSVVGTSHYLVVDADTVLVRPQVFERNGKAVFNYSDEYYQPYFDTYRRLLGESVRSPVSFTSHQMLFEVGLLRELKKRIEEVNRCSWHEAILRNLDRTEMSSSSDYDTYGQYVFSHYPNRIAIEYWFNLNLTRRKLRGLRWLELQYGGKYKSLSFHSYRK